MTGYSDYLTAFCEPLSTPYRCRTRLKARASVYVFRPFCVQRKQFEDSDTNLLDSRDILMRNETKHPICRLLGTRRHQERPNTVTVRTKVRSLPKSSFPPYSPATLTLATCGCVTSFERQLTPLCVDSASAFWALFCFRFCCNYLCVCVFNSLHRLRTLFCGVLLLCCHARGQPPDSVLVIPGDVVFADMCDVNDLENGGCGDYDVNILQHLVAVTWFIEEINKMNYVPGVTIGWYCSLWRTGCLCTNVWRLFMQNSVNIRALF